MLLKTSIIILFCSLITGHPSVAQQTKKPQLELNASIDLGSYYGYFLGGFGSHLRLLWPVGEKNNAITASVGIDRLHEELAYDAYSYTFLLTSVGYRKIIQQAFVEPKIGIGLSNEDGYSSFCGFIGIEPGIQKGKIDFFP